MAQEEKDGSDIADVTVETNDDGSKTATATTKDGDTGTGSSGGGVASEPSTQEATSEAAKDAKD